MRPIELILVRFVKEEADTRHSIYLFSRIFLPLEDSPEVSQIPSPKEFSTYNFVFALVCGFGMLILIALGESYVAKETTSPFQSLLSLENDQSSEISSPKLGAQIKRRSLRFRKGFLTKSSQKKHSLLKPSLFSASQKAEVMDMGNVSLVYKLFNNSEQPSFIFKPYEAPLGYDNNMFSISSKEQCLNEVHAYNFDQLSPKSLRSGVLETQHVTLASETLSGEKVGNGFVSGSLQKFASGYESCEDFGSALFSVDDVHKIGILDLKILNCDRHSGNMLFNPETQNLVPIDHALSFPELFTSKEEEEGSDALSKKLTLRDISFDWMLFPQSKKPFSSSVLQGIKELDIRSHTQFMKEQGLSVKQRMAVFSSLTLLKVAALQYKKTLHEIGAVIQRLGRREEPSTLEQLLEKYDTEGLDNEAEFQGFCEQFEQDIEDFFKV